MITVYTTQTCAYCAMLKKYLTQKNVEFETVDVTDDPDTREMLFEKTGLQSVPVTRRGEEFLAGFNVPLLQKLIA